MISLYSLTEKLILPRTTSITSFNNHLPNTITVIFTFVTYIHKTASHYQKATPPPVKNHHHHHEMEKEKTEEEKKMVYSFLTMQREKRQTILGYKETDLLEWKCKGEWKERKIRTKFLEERLNGRFPTWSIDVVSIFITVFNSSGLNCTNKCFYCGYKKTVPTNALNGMVLWFINAKVF